MIVTLEQVISKLPDEVLIRVGNTTMKVRKSEIKEIAQKAKNLGVPVFVPYCSMCNGWIITSDFNFLLGNLDEFLFDGDRSRDVDVLLVEGISGTGHLIVLTDGDFVMDVINRLVEKSNGSDITVTKATDPSIRIV